MLICQAFSLWSRSSESVPANPPDRNIGFCNPKARPPILRFHNKLTPGEKIVAFEFGDGIPFQYALEVCLKAKLPPTERGRFLTVFESHVTEASYSLESL